MGDDRQLGVGGLVFDARYVDHFESVSAGFLIEIPEPGVADVVQ